MANIRLAEVEMTQKVKRAAVIIAVILTFFLFFKFVFRLFLPFVIAFLFAAIFNTPIKILHQRTGISKKILGALTVILAVGVVGFTIVLPKLNQKGNGKSAE